MSSLEGIYNVDAKDGTFFIFGPPEKKMTVASVTISRRLKESEVLKY